MGKLPKQTKRRELIRRFRELGWTGPHDGVKGSAVGDHPQYMGKDKRVVKLPNPHRGGGDIGEVLLKKILAEACITVKQWLGEPEVDKAVGNDDDQGAQQ
jgi:hypothetical protein